MPLLSRKMMIPTLLTSLRIVLSPLFFFLFAYSGKLLGQLGGSLAVVALWLLFLVMELSDLIDGMAARRLGASSDFGKLFDPFADSFARLTYFAAFTLAPPSAGMARMPALVFLLILYRDLLVNFGRLLLAKEGVSFGARLSGKIKAWVYALAGGFGLAAYSLGFLPGLPLPLASAVGYATQALYWLAAATAVWTAADYLSSIASVLRSRRG